MNKYVFTVAALAALAFVSLENRADAGGFSVYVGGGRAAVQTVGYGGYGGYGGCGGGYGYQSFYHAPGNWHDTSHWDYHAPELRWHGNHFDYLPGHYDWHSDGHFHHRW